MENFNLLEKQYEAMIWKIIHSLHIYKNQEEFYQTGLIALWEASNGFDEEKGNFTSYAYPYIRGRILSELSNRSRHEEVCVYPKEEYWGTIEDEAVYLPLESETILTYCDRLTENQQKWVLYTALAGMSVKEIAEKENVSVSAVKTWRSGAREKIMCTLRKRPAK